MKAVCKKAPAEWLCRPEVRLPFLLSLAWRDLRASGRTLWVFCACLALGVALISAGGGLYSHVLGGLQNQARALYGGDLSLRLDQPAPAEELAWLQQRGTVTQAMELRTMLLSGAGHTQLVELQTVDRQYPLVGRLTLAPAAANDTPLPDLLAERDGRYGAALDALLAQRLGVKAGDLVEVGDATLEVRATVLHQPDRSLRADWGAAPVLVADAALPATGLVQAFSRVRHRVRVRIEDGRTPAAARADFLAAFPASDSELRGYDERSDRISEVLGQIGSGLLLVGFSALFIGGLGVFNSVQAHLQGKLGILATLRALGLRDGRLAALVLLQILLLAVLASGAGALAGSGLALAGGALVGERLPLEGGFLASARPLLGSAAVAVLFGVLTALTFALPALGRALTVSPAALFRGLDGSTLRTPRGAWVLTGISAAVVVALLLLLLPDPRFGAAFVGVTVALLALLEGVLRGLRGLATWALAHPRLGSGFELRVALAGLQRPGSPLRAALLSLGSALTLLVACTLVVSTLLRTVNETVPANAPALVFYDVQTEQLPALRAALEAAPSLQTLQTAPLVLGRVSAVNGEALRDSADEGRVREARDEQKLSNRNGNFDDVVLTAGAWWPTDYQGPPLLAMEDREANQLGIQVGDTLRWEILGQPLEARVAAIYAQRRFQSRLWLEAIFSDGVLDPYITRHVGAARLDAADAIAAQDRLAATAPNIVSVRTESVLQATRAIMGSASAGLAVIAGVCLAASLLVLASVVAASRTRQVYESSVMHTLGARLSSLRRVLRWEYTLLAAVTALFATTMGSSLALVLLQWRLELDGSGLLWTGALTALGVSTVSLGLGARYLLGQMQIAPARLLRAGA
jgi:putative ABC transport system permease protein